LPPRKRAAATWPGTAGWETTPSETGIPCIREGSLRSAHPRMEPARRSAVLRRGRPRVGTLRAISADRDPPCKALPFPAAIYGSMVGKWQWDLTGTGAATAPGIGPSDRRDDKSAATRLRGFEGGTWQAQFFATVYSALRRQGS
jgi:hypothetical protein